MEEDYRNTFDRQQDRLNEESKERVSRGEEKRASRKAQKDVRKAERLQLGSATSASERRDIKERFENIEQGVESGGIYDVSTDSYQPPEGNEAGANTNMSETGVQTVPRGDDDEFSVILCVNGFPFHASIKGQIGIQIV